MWDCFEYLDVEALLAARDQQHEAMVGANVGSYAIPIGPMLRRQIPGPGMPDSLPDCDDNGFCALDPALWSNLSR